MLDFVYVIISFLFLNPLLIYLTDIFVMNFKSEEEKSILYLYKDRNRLFIFLLSISQILLLFKKVNIFQSFLLLIIIFLCIIIYKMIEKPTLPIVDLLSDKKNKIGVIFYFALKGIEDRPKLYGYTSIVTFLNGKRYEHVFSHLNKNIKMDIINNLINKNLLDENQVIFSCNGKNFSDFDLAFSEMMKNSCSSSEEIIKNIDEYKKLYKRIYTNGDFDNLTKTHFGKIF